MKSAFAFVFMFIGFEPMLARPLPPLPTPAFADTEVTACHPLDQAMPSVCGLNFELAFRGTSSNNVEIVFGRDDDGDGVLSFRESDVRVGWDCGPASAPGAATRGRHLQLPGGDDSLLGFGMVCCLDLTPNDTDLVPRPSAIAAHTSLSDFDIIRVVLRFAEGPIGRELTRRTAVIHPATVYSMQHQRYTLFNRDTTKHFICGQPVSGDALT